MRVDVAVIGAGIQARPSPFASRRRRAGGRARARHSRRERRAQGRHSVTGREAVRAGPPRAVPRSLERYPSFVREVEALSACRRLPRARHPRGRARRDAPKVLAGPRRRCSGTGSVRSWTRARSAARARDLSLRPRALFFRTRRRRSAPPRARRLRRGRAAVPRPDGQVKRSSWTAAAPPPRPRSGRSRRTGSSSLPELEPPRRGHGLPRRVRPVRARSRSRHPPPLSRGVSSRAGYVVPRATAESCAAPPWRGRFREGVTAGAEARPRRRDGHRPAPSTRRSWNLVELPSGEPDGEPILGGDVRPLLRDGHTRTASSSRRITADAIAAAILGSPRRWTSLPSPRRAAGILGRKG